MLYDLFQYSNLLPVLCGLLLWSKLPRSLRIITLIPFADFLAEYISMWAKYSMQNNLWFFNQYRLVQVLLISWYYSSQFENPRWKKNTWLVAAGLVLLGELSTFLLGWKEYNTPMFIVSGAFYLMIAAAWFIQLLGKFPIAGLERNPHFFINTGLFVFFAVSFVLFASLAILLPEDLELWAVFRISRIFRNVFLAAGLIVFYFSWQQTASRSQ